MVSNGDKYKPLQAYPEDHAEFVRLCKDQNVAQVSGFKLAVESWKARLNEEVDNV